MASRNTFPPTDLQGTWLAHAQAWRTCDSYTSSEAHGIRCAIMSASTPTASGPPPQKAKTWAAGSIHDGELVSKRDDFQVQRGSRPDQEAKGVKEQDDDGGHDCRLSENARNLNLRNTDRVLGRHKWPFSVGTSGHGVVSHRGLQVGAWRRRYHQPYDPRMRSDPAAACYITTSSHSHSQCPSLSLVHLLTTLQAGTTSRASGPAGPCATIGCPPTAG